MSYIRYTMSSVRELLAQLLRSASASRRYPHVKFSHNVSVAPDCHFGNYVTVFSNARLASATVGDYSYVGGGALLQNVTIGKFCSLGANVCLGLGVHPVENISTYPGFYSARSSGSKPFVKETIFTEHLPVCIGHDVWIGMGARVMDGVKIGHGAIIGAGAIVNRDVPPYAVVAGVPAKLLRYRFDEDMISFLLRLAWWDRDETFLRSHAHLFNEPTRFREILDNKVG